MGIEGGILGLGGYHITRFTVTATDDIAPLELLALSSTGILIRFSRKNLPVELGAIADGRFVALTSRECEAEIVTKLRVEMALRYVHSRSPLRAFDKKTKSKGLDLKDGGGQDHPPRDFHPVDSSSQSLLIPMADQVSASEAICLQCEKKYTRTCELKQVSRTPALRHEIY